MSSFTAFKNVWLFRRELSYWETMRFICLVAVVLTLPFSFHINSICIMLMGACWLLENGFRDKALRLKQNKFALFSMSFYLLNVAGMLYTSNVKPGMSDLETKLSIFVFPLILGTTSPLGRQYVDWVLSFFVASCTLALTLCLGKAIFHYFSFGTTQYFFYHELSRGIGIHAVYLALYLSFSLFILTRFLIAYWRPLKPLSRALLLVLMVVMLITILLLSSKTIIISLVLFADVFLIILLLSRKKQNLSLLLMFLINLLAVLAILYVPFIRERFKDSLATDIDLIKNNDYNIVLTGISMRTGIWTYSLEILHEQNSWVLGVGTGDSQSLLNNMYVRKNWYLGVPGTSDQGYLGYNAHNQYIQFLLCLGLVGLICFLIYFTIPVIKAIKTKNYLLAALVLFFSICCLTESMLNTQKGVVFYVLFSSLLLYQTDSSSPAQETLPIHTSGE